MSELSQSQFHDISPAVTNSVVIQGIKSYEPEEKVKRNTEGNNSPLKVSYFLS